MRVHVRALILHDAKVVVAREGHRGRTRITLPGGRVDQAESTHEALVREVRQETGLVVAPQRLLYIAEVFAPHRIHELILVFSAEVVESTNGTMLHVVDPAAPGETVLPPILPQIARDLETGGPAQPRWLGNVYDPELLDLSL
jgi:8-oxo-dGTP pyrophosphatase MutT (NUDIX family)